jgi:hypothetical protein
MNGVTAGISFLDGLSVLARLQFAIGTSMPVFVKRVSVAAFHCVFRLSNFLILLSFALQRGSSQSSPNSDMNSAMSSGGISRLVILPRDIHAGGSFTLSLRGVTASEQKLAFINVSLTSSKLNEGVRILRLKPRYVEQRLPGGLVSRAIDDFFLEVRTVRLAAASRSDLEAVHVLPGTKLVVSYTPLGNMSENIGHDLYSEDSNWGPISMSPELQPLASATMTTSVMVAFEPSILLPPFVTPGQYPPPSLRDAMSVPSLNKKLDVA